MNQVRRQLGQQALESKALIEGRLHAPSACPLAKESSHEKCATEDQHSSNNLPSIKPPQRRALVAHDAAGRKPALTDAPAPEFPTIEQVAGRALVNNGKTFRSLSSENTQRKVSGLRPLRLVVEEPSPHDSMPEIRFRPAVDGGTRGPRQDGQRSGTVEGASG